MPLNFFNPLISNAQDSQDKTVRLVYLVSKDRQMQTNYVKGN